MADLVRSRGHRRATLVGHSLGGAVAMRIAQTYPDLCGRLVLVSSGGLGGDLLPLIKATNLPGAELALSLVANPATLTVGSVLARLGGRWSVEDRELARCFSSLSDPRNRAAYVRIARNSIAADTQQAIVVPTLVLWGERDWIIPVKHGRKAGRRLLNSRLEVISGAEHFPHLSEPHLVAQHLIDFISRTRPVTPMTGIAAAG